jgi:anti-sigma B factor antagonist
MSDPQQPISVTTRWDERTAVIQLAGELDLHSAGELGTAIDEVLAESPAAIDIDAQGLSFADSAGLRALLLEMTGLREILGVPVT